MRCRTLRTGWHVTAKSSICAWGVVYESGAYVAKALCLTPRDLCSVRTAGLRRERSFLSVVQKSAEDILGTRAPKARTVPG